jgi:hypothetical protein
MNRSIVPTLVLAALVAYPASALGADKAPDVKGKWIGKTHTILVGKGGHWPKGRGTWDKPTLLEKDLVIDITGQDGRHFWGVTTISGGGRRPMKRSSANSPARTTRALSSPTPTASGTDKSIATTRCRSATCIRAAGASPPQSAARRSSECADLALWDFDPACGRFRSAQADTSLERAPSKPTAMWPTGLFQFAN